MNPRDIQNQIEVLQQRVQDLETNAESLVGGISSNRNDIFTIDTLVRKHQHTGFDNTRKIADPTIFTLEVTENTALTAAFTIEPATSYHVLSATAARTSSTTNAIADGLKRGQILILEGTDNTNTITIKDGANTNLGADRVLGAEDNIVLIWNTVNWIELSFSNI